jgi:hypothetical protein
MGLLDGMLGNASKIDAAKISDEFDKILVPGEKVEHAYQLIRDYFVFTDKRLVLVDKQGLTGSKVAYHSIPYRSITHFSIETGGTLDLDAELKIWISSTPAPLLKQFNKRLSIYEVQTMRCRPCWRATCCADGALQRQGPCCCRKARGSTAASGCAKRPRRAARAAASCAA